MTTPVDVAEFYGSGDAVRTYWRKSDDKLFLVNAANNKYRSITQTFKSVFLPQGYPDSVSSDYLTYQIWDTVQAFASSITGTIAAQAVFRGYGVGDEKATAAGATITWLLKDGTGMLGRIIFAWYQGPGLDCDAKRWRLFADILNDGAIFLEILAPMFSDYFTAIVCIAGLGKSIVGVAGVATRAALTQHQARRNNMADVSAKDGSQETLVNLAALLVSLTLIPAITGQHTLMWILFISFTCLHLFANYRAVTCVVMETLNQARLHIIMNWYLRKKVIPSTQFVNQQEPVVFSTQRSLSIHLGSQLQNLVKTSIELHKLRGIFEKDRYILNVNLARRSINIALDKSSSMKDQLLACYHAEVINFAYTNPDCFGILPRVQGEEHSMTLIRATLNYTKLHYTNTLLQLQNQGWLLSPLLLGANEWRYSYDHGHKIL